MDYYVIKGGRKLNGDVAISGSKNAALPLITAALMIKGEVLLHNVPNLMDIRTILKLVESLGAKVEFDPAQGDVRLDCRHIHSIEAPYELVKTMRASTYAMGPLLARMGEAKVSMPGGCAIGQRPIDIHLAGFEALGAHIDLEHGDVHAYTLQGSGKSGYKLQGGEFRFKKVSVGATANILMAASLAKGQTVLENAALEPEVTVLADFLNRAGAKISGHGSKQIVIQGVRSLKPVEYHVIPDRIETGTMLLAGAITRGKVRVGRTEPYMVQALLDELERIGFELGVGQDWISLEPGKKLEGIDVKTKVYPGFPTDLQAPMMSLMTTLPGLSVMIEDIFENRYTHIGELLRLGADISVENGVAIIRGKKKLMGTQVMMTDLRAGAALVLAALSAEGKSEIRRIYHTDRGYELFEDKLNSLGAQIERKAGGSP